MATAETHVFDNLDEVSPSPSRDDEIFFSAAPNPRLDLTAHVPAPLGSPSVAPLRPSVPQPEFISPSFAPRGVSISSKKEDSLGIGNFAGAEGDNVEAFLRLFDLVLAPYSLSPSDKLLHLLKCLRGKARNWTATLPTSVYSDYAAVRSRLLQHFGEAVGPSPATRLMSLRQGPTQSVFDFRKDFDLAMRHSTIDADSVLYRDFFVSALRDDLRSIARAQVDAMDLDQLTRFCAAREADSAATAKRLSASRPSTSSPSTFASRAVCHHCGEHGHIRPDCPKLASAAGSPTTARPGASSRPGQPISTASSAPRRPVGYVQPDLLEFDQGN